MERKTITEQRGASEAMRGHCLRETFGMFVNKIERKDMDAFSS